MPSSPKLIFLFLVLLTGLRLAYIGRVELTPDEAYYQMWSERLDWGYYSKGPGVAVAIRAGTALFGPTEFGVRFLSPLFWRWAPASCSTASRAGSTARGLPGGRS